MKVPTFIVPPFVGHWNPKEWSSRTPGDARRLARDENAANRQKREAQEVRHAKFTKELAEQVARATRPTSSLSLASFWQRRHAAAAKPDPPNGGESHAPPPRTLGDIARRLYHREHGYDGGLIATSSRGGAR